ncbi:DUF6518 family protein [Janibacter melonis]|uniref:DUF6518 family protein n=1 Tax=Janibacter melonis TaxID=262209 RepID=UPI0020445905|nr:DUF6518 family protein [Janibacter melonis]MCM3556734.1 DUF6518 family protein [Janibacter melonis]
MRRAWALVALVGAGLAVLTLLAAAAADQLDGHPAARVVLVLANAGSVWAGQAVLAGWLVRRAPAAALAGPVVGLLSLVTYYVLGALTGLTPWSGLADNLGWLVAAAVAGVPLGLVGALARRRDGLGVLARLVVPAGAVLEPLVRGWLDGGVGGGGALGGGVLGVAGLVLIVAGLAGGALVVRRRIVTSR